MGFRAYENLKGFVHSRPPLVVFMICIGLFAIVLMSLAYYVENTKVRNPDVSRDWNVFLESFQDLDFCIQANNTDIGVTGRGVTSSVSTPTSTVTPPIIKTRELQTTDATSPNPYEGVKNHSVAMLLTIQPTPEFLAIHHNVTHLTGTLLGSQIGLKGNAADEPINVSMELAYEWNNTKCSVGSCNPVQIYTCVFFQANVVVFPMSNSPKQCELVNDTGIDYYARLVAQRPHPYTSYYCRSRSFIKVHHERDPSLTVFLGTHESSVINLHLMHTSYFLFVMVVMLFCYAVIRGRPVKSKLTQTEQAGSLMSSHA